MGRLKELIKNLGSRFRIRRKEKDERESLFILKKTEPATAADLETYASYEEYQHLNYEVYNTETKNTTVFARDRVYIKDAEGNVLWQ